MIGLVSASLGPTLPGLADNTRSQLAAISVLFTVRSVGYLLGSFAGGRSYDRLLGHPVIAGALLLIAVMMALAPTLLLLWSLAAAFVVVGIAEGAVDVGGNTLLVWVHGDRVGPFMNGLHFFFGLGAFLSPLIVAYAMQASGDVALAYWALALLIVPVAVSVLRLPSPARPALASSATSSIRRPALAAAVAVFFALYVGAEVSFGGWIYSYVVALGLTSATSAAYLTSAFWGAFTLGRLLAIPIAVRIRPRTILLAALSGCLASMSVILLWPDSLLAVWIGTIGAGLSMAPIFPTMLSLAGRRMTITGQVTGWFLVGASLGSMSLPWLIGQLFEAIGPRVTMLAILGDLLLAVGVFVVLILASAGSIQDESRR
jgi:FHS family Na+ dependent glucose MFS transporter 1